MHSFTWQLTPFVSHQFCELSASITSAIGVQLLFHCLKPREAFHPSSLCQWIQHRVNGLFRNYNDALSELL